MGRHWVLSTTCRSPIAGAAMKVCLLRGYFRQCQIHVFANKSRRFPNRCYLGCFRVPVALIMPFPLVAFVCRIIIRADTNERQQYQQNWALVKDAKRKSLNVIIPNHCTLKRATCTCQRKMPHSGTLKRFFMKCSFIKFTRTNISVQGPLLA